MKLSYSDYGKFQTELSAYDAIIDNTEFADEVIIDFAIKSDDNDSFSKRITDLFNGKINPIFKKTRIDTK